MTRRFALSGSYPRREGLVKATWDFDKGLLSPDRLREEYLGAVRDVVALQARLGAEAVTDGNLNWHDAFRGLIEDHPAFEVGGLVRLFETNKFYRQPVLTGHPTVRPEALGRHFLLESIRPGRPKKAVLPGPYWWARAAKVETGDADEASTHIAQYLNDVARWLVGEGYAQIQFNEPLLFYERDADLALAHRLFETALRGLEATTIVNFPNGNAAPHVAWAAALPATVIGLDFVETHVEDLSPPAKPKPLLAAVVDSQESLHEDPAELERLVDRIEERLRPPHVTLTHTWDLEFLPAPVAEKKLERLASVAQRTVTA